MKKKDFLFSLPVILLAAVMSLGLVSCGDDDDDVTNEVTSALVGTWVQEINEKAFTWYMGFKLNKEGTFSYSEWNKGEEPKWQAYGSWSANDGILTLKEPDGDMFSLNYTISDDGKKLYLGSGTYGYDYSGTYTKQ